MLYTEGCHNHLSLAKKIAPFRRQTCGTSTNVLKIRSVSDTFENGKKVHPEAPRSGHIQKKCTICNACNVCPIEFMYLYRYLYMDIYIYGYKGAYMSLYEFI